jgi:hypothetical protein
MRRIGVLSHRNSLVQERSESDASRHSNPALAQLRRTFPIHRHEIPTQLMMN